MNAPLAALDSIKSAVATEVEKALFAFAKDKLPTDVDFAFVFSLLEKPPESRLGDYAFPCFRFAKSLQMKPQDIAAKIKEHLDAAKHPYIADVHLVGAFLNIYVNKMALAASVLNGVRSGDCFKKLAVLRQSVKQKVMIEFSQPNTHKVFHVGHIRNVALGDSLCRLFRYYGDDVIATNYPGDEGAHVAKTLWYLNKNKLVAPEHGKGEWLGQQYADANALLSAADGEQKKQYEKEISAVLAQIEQKQAPVYQLWRETREWSLQSFYAIYKFLGVHFDKYFFESEVSEESQRIVDEYLKKGVFVVSDGAIGCDLSAYDLGFMLVRKRDGNTLYATKDLVLARRKFDEFKVERSVYVVGSEQSLHFRQVFKTLELMGFPQAKQCFHLSYGLVRLPESKMSSRDGTIVTFQALRDSVEQELELVLSKYKDQWTAEQFQDTKTKLCIGAIKYGMLSTDPVKDVAYVASEWVSFEGDTGPYLMYSYARARSIIRKAEELGVVPDNSFADLLTHDAEHDLLRYLYDFNDVVVHACEQYKPSLLSHHLFDMSKAMNRMYAQLSVLKAESKDLLQARVNLMDAFAKVLAKGLDLLGITPPEQM